MYDPGTGRFMQRDPSGTPGFNTPRISSNIVNRPSNAFVQRDRVPGQPKVFGNSSSRQLLTVGDFQGVPQPRSQQNDANKMYPDGMNLYAAYHVMHGGVDPSGLVWRKTGLQWCNGTLHGYIKLTNGRGYGFYAESHVAGNATIGDDIAAIGYAKGLVNNTDHIRYPNATCKDIWISDCCMDVQKYVQAVESHVTSFYAIYNQNTTNRTFYNALTRNCYTWREDVTHGQHTNAARLPNRPWKCSILLRGSGRVDRGGILPGYYYFD